MLKPILMAGAMLFAIPALAQSTGTQSSGTPTTTNDHDPTMEEDDATAEGAATVGTQANGGIISSQTSTGADSNAQGTTGTNHQGMNHGTTGQTGTTTGGTMTGGASGGAMSGGTPGGAMSGGTMSGGAMQGAQSYPPCSRTVTDSCIQTNERGRARRR
jgi:hypothetical protein